MQRVFSVEEGAEAAGAPAGRCGQGVEGRCHVLILSLAPVLMRKVEAQHTFAGQGALHLTW